MDTPELLLGAIVGVAVILGVVMVWPQAGFVLFLSILLAKPILRSYMPFLVSYTLDMTVTVIAFIGVAWHALRVGSSARGMIPRGFMVAWIILMLLVWIMLPFSRQMAYGWKKALIFSIFDTLTVLLPLLYFRRFHDARSLLMICAFLGLIASIGVAFFPSVLGTGHGAERTTFLGADPLAPADFSSYLIIILLSLWIAERRLWQAVGVIVLVPLAVYAIVATGSRGPLFSLPVVILSILFLFRRRINFLFIASSGLIALLVLVASLEIVTPEMTGRFKSRFIAKGFADRTALADITVTAWLANPILGNGTGDTAYQIGGPDFQGYPHNLLLEVANELGLLGLACMLIVFGYAIKVGFMLSREDMEGTYAKTVTVPFFGCFLHHLLFSFKTGGYGGSYTTFFFIGCTVALGGLWRIEQAGLAESSTEPWLGDHPVALLPHAGNG